MATISIGAIKNLNCLIRIINSDNLVILKFRNFKVDLKKILEENSNALQCLMSKEFKILKLYEIDEYFCLTHYSSYHQIVTIIFSKTVTI